MSNSVLKPARAYTRYVVTDLALPAATPRDIPARASDMPTGSAFMASIARLTGSAREAAVHRELLAGNIPSFLRTLRTVRATRKGADSVAHTVEYEVMPDYLAIGSDKDFVRIPVTPSTAQAFGDAFGFVLPTRRMVNDIWTAATTHLEPIPHTEAREATPTFLQHDRMIEAQLAGMPRGTFVAGVKKDVVVTPLLSSRPGKVAIYGWHYITGAPIQPLYTGHVDWYVDYSHGVRPVRRAMRVDGVVMAYERILADSLRHVLLSDEGLIPMPRYEQR